MAERPTNKQEVWNKGARDLETPPVEGAYLAEDGWRLPLKGTDPADGLSELLVAVGQDKTTAVDATEANVDIVAFLPKADGTDYAQGDTLRVAVLYNELVDVTAGATITVSSTGGGGDFVATAAGQTGVNEVIFEATIPAETATLSLAAQTLTGTIVDSSDATASDLVVTADAVADAEDIDIA